MARSLMPTARPWRTSTKMALAGGIGLTAYLLWRATRQTRVGILVGPDGVPETELLPVPEAPGSPRPGGAEPAGPGHVTVMPVQTITPHPTAPTAAQIQAVVRAQAALQMVGISVGPTGADGHLGPATRAGLRTFQAARHLRVTGDLDGATRPLLEAIYAGPVRP